MKSYALKPLESKSPDNPKNVLPLKTRLAYSVGHFLNDLCASVWFSYTLLFFKLDFDKTTVGSLMLLGQVADALSTPLIGYLSDRGNNESLLCTYGRRKTWHLLGTVLILVSFPFIYNNCFWCGDTYGHLKVPYYAGLIVVFQFGWAAVQVVHVSLITDLTPLTSERVELNAYRQASTVAANVLVYSITLFLIETRTDDRGVITQSDAWIFGVVAVIICFLGTCFSIVFHVLVKEPQRAILTTSDDEFYRKLPDGQSQNLQNALKQQTLTLDRKEARKGVQKSDPKVTVQSEDQKSCRDWLRSVSFWKIGLIYMMSRLYFNLSQVYTPLYLQSSLQMNKGSIAVVPFVTYSTGFVFSLMAKPLSIRTGSKFVLLMGCLLGITSSGWLYFGSETDPIFVQYEVYFATAFNGLGSTAILISSLALTADLVGNNTETGAFVFGVMSFLDKLINGLAVFLIEQVNPAISTQTGKTPVREMFYKHVLVFVAGGGVVFTLLGLLLIRNSRFGRRQRKSESDHAAKAANKA